MLRITGVFFLIIFAIGIVIVSIKKKLKGDSLNVGTMIISVIAIIVGVLVASPLVTDDAQQPTNENSFGSKVELSTTVGYTDNKSQSEDSNFDSYLANKEGNTSNEDSIQNESNSNSLEQPSTSKGEQADKIEIVPFYEIKTYSQKGSVTKEEIVSDPRGNTYNDAYVFWAQYTTLNTGGGYYDKPCLEKFLGGMYKEFSLKIIPYEDFDKYNKNIEATVKIYADDKLIYTSDSITRKTDCEEITLSIENVNYLRIELKAGTDLTSYYNQYSMIIYDANLTAK